MLIRLLACGGMGAARLVELAISARNVRERGGVESRRAREIYPFIVGLHAITIFWTLIRGRNLSSPGWLALLLSVQPLRIWILRTLGDRWNTRAAVPLDMPVETGGPYRLIRHPNYVVVVVELAALPLAFGLRWFAMAVALVNAVLLAIRIGEEERALMRVPGYRETMGRRPRFIPWLF